MNNSFNGVVNSMVGFRVIREMSLGLMMDLLILFTYVFEGFTVLHYIFIFVITF